MDKNKNKIKLKNLTVFSSNYGLQLTLGHKENDRGSFGLVFDLDCTLIGTENYMGMAYFWDHDVKHTMRDVTPKVRKVIHDTALRENLFVVDSEFGGKYVPTCEKFIEIINLAVTKFKLGNEYLISGAN